MHDRNSIGAHQQVRDAIEVGCDDLYAARVSEALEKPGIDGRRPQRANACHHMAELQALLQADLIPNERILIPAYAHVFVLKQDLSRVAFAYEVLRKHQEFD